MALRQWLHLATQRLRDRGVDSPALEAQVLAAHVLRVDRSYVLSHPELDFPELAGEHVLQRRESGEPLAYILGYREFYGRCFRVAPGVLIPRHETETLVDAVIERSRGDEHPRVLDLGTGSGCIGVTIKMECPRAEVTCSDVSERAVDIAAENARQLDADVRVICSDGFREFVGEAFDIIVTNPPYIATGERLPADVSEHEPGLALYSGATGLEFYERLATEAAEYLVDDGRLMMEVGYTQARDVSLIFEAAGWHVTEVHKDLWGIDRVVVVQPVFACA